MQRLSGSKGASLNSRWGTARHPWAMDFHGHRKDRRMDDQENRDQYRCGQNHLP